jgi:hypothetical protein
VLLACAVVAVWFAGRDWHADTRTSRVGNQPTSDGLQQGKALPPVVHTPAPQRDSFAILRSPAEGLPATTTKLLRQSRFGMNWALAHRLSASVPGAFWAVPGNGFLCIVQQLDTHSVAQTCATTAQALAHGVVSVAIDAVPADGPTTPRRLIVGIAPDRARIASIRTGGSVVRAPISGNVFVVRDTADDPPDSVSLL